MAVSLSENAHPRRLAELLSSGRAWEVGECLEFVIRLAEQVHGLHRCGRLHRSIDAHGVLVGEEGRPQLSDPPLRQTLGGEWWNPELCPPELASGEPCDLPSEIESAAALLRRSGHAWDPRRIDVYQLGCLLCRLVTGEPLQSYLYSSVAKASVPAPLRTVFDRSLGYDATQRIVDCREFMAAIAESSGGAVAAPAVSDTTLVGRDGTRSKIDSGATPRREFEDAESGVLPHDAPRRLGACRLVARLGQGGMGEVYRAFDESLGRYVAVKVLRRQLAIDSDFVQRFRAEASAVARLSHPNIVQVYSIGEDDGRPFFVMQLIDGESLAVRLRREGRLEASAALAFLEPCLAGLAAAHGAGLVHRDIKPGNILLDRQGRALLADFGLVKRIDQSSGVTATGVVVGTVDYLSPEQGRGSSVDARSDLYSVGVLLYRALSGELPFTAESPAAMIFKHAYETPRPLSAVVSGVSADLAAIVARLLQKEPAKRYQTVAELLDDLRALNAGRRAPRGKRARQAIERPWRRVIFAAAVAFAVPAGWLGALVWQDRFRPPTPPPRRDNGVVREQMQASLTSEPTTAAFCPEALGSSYTFLAGHRDGTIFQYLINHDGAVSLHHRMAGHLRKVEKITYSPDGVRAASASEDQTVAVWDLHDYRQSRRLQGHTGAIHDLKFSADGRQLLSCGRDGLRLWDIQTETELEHFAPDSPWNDLHTLAWSPDGSQVALGTRIHGYPNLILLDISARKVLRTFPATDAVTYAAFLPNKRHLLSVSGEIVQIWDINKGYQVRKFGKGGNSAAISPDGRLILVGNNSGVARLFDIETGQFLGEFGPHTHPVITVAFSPDGRLMLAGSVDRKIRLFETPKPPPPDGQLGLYDARSPVRAAAFSPKGEFIVAASERSLESLRLQDYRSARSLPAERLISAVAFSPGGRGILYATDQAKSRRNYVGFLAWSASGFVIDRYPVKDVRRFYGFAGRVTAAAYLPDGQRMAAAGDDGGVQIWNLETNQRSASFKLDSPIRCLAAAPDGRRLLLGADDSAIHVWDGEANRELAPLAGHDGAVLCVAVSRAGRVVSGGVDRTLRVWKPETGECLLVLRGHYEPVNAAAVSADGQFVLSGGADQTVRLWKTASGKELKKFVGHSNEVRCVAISADGALGLSGGDDGTVRVWDLAKFID